MTKDLVIGLRPWLPWPLCRSPWWTQPVRAERLAALRIGVAGVLLLDLLTTYLPHARDFFGGGSLGAPGVFPWVGTAPNWNWSLLRGVEDQRVILAAIVVWCVATFALLVGYRTRLSAVLTWVLSSSFAGLNPNLDNAGDIVRGIVLFYLMLCPCGAVWSLDHRLRTRREVTPPRVFVYPWVLRLLFIQMTLIYFCNGLYKVMGHEWRSGESLYYVLGDLTLARWSYAQVAIPFWVTRLLSWAVMDWEVSFPLLMGLPWLGRRYCPRFERVLRRVRVIALWFGVAFHVGIGAMLELGWFAPYMLCLYLPLVPWEDYGRSWFRRWRAS
jgi:hypothetical protein